MRVEDQDFCIYLLYRDFGGNLLYRRCIVVFSLGSAPILLMNLAYLIEELRIGLVYLTLVKYCG